MKVFVTGVGGQLGFDVVNELKKRSYEAIGSDILDEVAASVFPFVNKLRNHLNRVLKIGANRNYAIAVNVEHSIIRGIELTEVFSIQNSLDFRILPANFPNQRTGIIRRAVIHNKYFIIIGIQQPYRNANHAPRQEVFWQKQRIFAGFFGKTAPEALTSSMCSGILHP